MPGKTKDAVSVRLDRENREELDRLAMHLARDRSYLVNEAVGSYLARMRWEEEHVRESLRQESGKVRHRGAGRGRLPGVRQPAEGMRVRYTPIAVADLHALASYALKHLDEGAVEVLVETLREAIEVLIVHFPTWAGSAG